MSNLLIAIGAYVMFVALHVVITRWIVRDAVDDILLKIDMSKENIKTHNRDSIAQTIRDELRREIAKIRLVPGRASEVRTEVISKIPDDGTIPLNFQPEAPRGMRRALEAQDAEKILEQLHQLH